MLHLLVSPGHNYVRRLRDGPGRHQAHDLDEVRLEAGRGVVGDRFHGDPAHVDGAVTLLAIEALEAGAAELGAAPFDPLLPRRNVVLRGADVNGLQGHEFALGPPDTPSRALLVGVQPADPCGWLDVTMGPGTRSALRGRGGLRCRVAGDGVLRRGPAVLVSRVELDPAAAGRPALRGRRVP